MYLMLTRILIHLLSSLTIVMRVVAIPSCIKSLVELTSVIVRMKLSFGSRPMRSLIIGPVKQVIESDAGMVTVVAIPDGV